MTIQDLANWGDIAERKSPWASLSGVKPGMNLAQVREHAGLRWEPLEAPVVNMDTGQKLDSHKAIYRSDNDKSLGVVGKSYELISNTEYFEFVDFVTQEIELEIETCGSLYGGAKVYTCFKTGDWAPKGDADNQIGNYLSVVTSHDGTVSMRVLPRSFRIVCSNTFYSSIQRSSKNEAFNALSIKHAVNWKQRSKEVVIMFNELVAAQTNDRVYADFLSTMPLSSRRAHEYFDDVLPDVRPDVKNADKADEKRDETIDHLLDLMHGPTGAGSTYWSAYQAVVEQLDWFPRNKPRSNFHKRAESKMDRTMFRPEPIKEKALDMALEMAGFRF